MFMYDFNSSSIYKFGLSVCLSVCLSVSINVKTAEPIGPKFFVGHHVTTGKLKIRKIFFFFVLKCKQKEHVHKRPKNLVSIKSANGFYRKTNIRNDQNLHIKAIIFFTIFKGIVLNRLLSTKFPLKLCLQSLLTGSSFNFVCLFD